jgi:hypothetical protein
LPHFERFANWPCYALKDLPPPEVPLHRLLRRQEAAALLAGFENLLPRGNLALIGADGRVYAGSAEWNRAELQRLHAQVGEGQIICAEGVALQPVFVQSRLWERWSHVPTAAQAQGRW